MTEYLRTAESAKLIRAALKENFPGVKFSVRSKSYSGGGSARVSWTDGPPRKAVKAITQDFQGTAPEMSGADIIYMPRSVNGVHHGTDFVHLDRQNVETVDCRECGWVGPPTEVIESTAHWDPRPFHYCPECKWRMHID